MNFARIEIALLGVADSESATGIRSRTAHIHTVGNADAKVGAASFRGQSGFR
jgi:hypothetical protein